MLITLLANSAGDINLTFKTVYSETLDLLIKLFESKDGEDVFPTEPACFSSEHPWEVSKAQVPCFLIHGMKLSYNPERTNAFLPKYENPNKQKFKMGKWGR